MASNTGGVIKSLIRQPWLHFKNDSLFRNSIYLMINTGIISIFGFFFWILVARLFTIEQIGLATTMISIISLITSFSLLGLDIGLIRFLPKFTIKNNQINTCFLITAITTAFILLIFLLGINIFSPKLIFIVKSSNFTLFFIIFAIFSTVNSLIDNIYISYRNTKYILIKNTIFSFLKLVFPFFLVSFGAFGIFSSYMAALIIGFSVAFSILIIKFDFRPQLIIHRDTIRQIGRYSFGNYAANFFGGLPTLILPLLITNMLNPEITAYYYISMMIVGLLFVIPVATTQSLFAEGSNNSQNLHLYVKKASKIIALFLIPTIFAILFFGQYILIIFGKNYSQEGLIFLQILAISGIFVSINTVFGTVLRVYHKIKTMIFVNFLGSLSILGFSYLLISKGLFGIGIAWIAGNILVSIVFLTLMISKNARLKLPFLSFNKP